MRLSAATTPARPRGALIGAAQSVTLCVTLCASLCACADIDASVEIGPEGSGRLELRYSVSRMVAPLTSLGEDSGLPAIPLSRADMERRVEKIEGLTLESFTVEEGEAAVKASASISFSSPAGLASFLDAAGERALYSEEGGLRKLKLVLSGGREGAALRDPDFIKLSKAAFAEDELALSVGLPSPALSAGAASVDPSGRRLRYSISVSALAESADPVIWELSW